ncbi:MAG: AmpG family muropeptide MFS transporter [Alphaproteobacteria bacterium]
MSQFINRIAELYWNRRILIIGLLGFSSGIPLFLTSSTLAQWLCDEGISLTAIGFFGAATFPYSIKFLWAPLLDRMQLPFLTQYFGRRRGWLIVSHLLLMAGLIGFGMVDPASNLTMVMTLALIVNFAAATQNVLMLAYQMESLEKKMYGPGESIGITGYRIAMILSGAGALYMETIISWNAVYLVMAALVGIGLVTVLLIPEPDPPHDLESEKREAKICAHIEERYATSPRLAKTLSWLHTAAVAPFTDFMRRPGWVALIMLMVFYKLGDNILGTMPNLFYRDLGFSKVEIANASKLFGMCMSVLGGIIGGYVVTQYGFLRTILLGVILHGVANLMLVAMYYAGYDPFMLYFSIGIEHITSGFRTTALFAYQLTLCNTTYAATQLALLTSFVSFGRFAFTPFSGWLAEALGWVDFFYLSFIAVFPGIFILLYLMRVYGVSLWHNKISRQAA